MHFVFNFPKTITKNNFNEYIQSYHIMAEVRPDEVSAILREQLSGARTEAELEEVGTVLQVGDGVARIYGLSKAQAGELLEFENGLKAMVLNLEEDNVGAVLFGDSK